jgi:hypothetical protein
MIKKILKLFGIDDKSTSSEDEEISNSISFIFTKTDPFIKILITQVSDTDSINFANILHDINNGSYVNSIISLLVDMGKKDKDMAIFTKKVLIKWGNLKKNNLLTSFTDDINEPIVKPTHFYKLSKNE